MNETDTTTTSAANGASASLEASKVEARIERELERTIANMRNVWPSAADYNVDDDDNVQVFDAQDNVLAVITTKRLEDFYCDEGDCLCDFPTQCEGEDCGATIDNGAATGFVKVNGAWLCEFCEREAIANEEGSAS